MPKTRTPDQAAGRAFDLRALAKRNRPSGIGNGVTLKEGLLAR